MRLDLTGCRLAAKENRERVVQTLGWFGIGLGLAQLLAPRLVCALIGVRPRKSVMRLLGWRELATGVGLLTQSEKAPWLRARLAGDAVDLGLLTMAAFDEGSRAAPLALAAVAVAGVTTVDYLASKEYEERPEPHTRQFARHPSVIHVRRSIIVDRPVEQLYQVWNNFRELPRFMHNVHSIVEVEDGRWHWVVQGPAGIRAEWDVEIMQERPNEFIAWRSLPNADVEHSGSVRFEQALGGRGTLVRVEVRYRPPAGKAGAFVATLLGKSPEAQIAGDLRRFKQLMETGELARTEGQPAGRLRSTSRVFDDFVRA